VAVDGFQVPLLDAVRLRNHEYGEPLKARISVPQVHPFNYSLSMDFKKVISEAAHNWI
jgi:hypothetical protein